MSTPNVTSAPQGQQNLLGRGLGQRTIQQQKNFMLKLLAVQMENQNPLKPMDSSKVGQQLAAFAQVEQQQQTNKLLKSLITNVQGLKAANPQSYIGKTAQVASTVAKLDSTGHGKWTYRVPSGTKSVLMKITDEKGREVFKRSVTNLSAGENRVNWKGPVDKQGKPVPGKFTISIVAYNAEGKTSRVTNINSIGKIEKAEINDKGDVFFHINGKIFHKSKVKYVG